MPRLLVAALLLVLGGCPVRAVLPPDAAPDAAPEAGPTDAAPLDASTEDSTVASDAGTDAADCVCTDCCAWVTNPNPFGTVPCASNDDCPASHPFCCYLGPPYDACNGCAFPDGPYGLACVAEADRGSLDCTSPGFDVCCPTYCTLGSGCDPDPECPTERPYCCDHGNLTADSPQCQPYPCWFC